MGEGPGAPTGSLRGPLRASSGERKTGYPPFVPQPNDSPSNDPETGTPAPVPSPRPRQGAGAGDLCDDPHGEVARSGTQEDVGQLLEDFRSRIARMLTVRMDPRLRGRLDASDVIQDTFLEVHNRLEEYRDRRDMPFFLWVRFLAGQKLTQMHRKHLGAGQRDARRELPDALRRIPGATTATLAGALMSTGVTPSEVAMRMEDEERLIRVLDELRELDREVLALRHFEGLSNMEVAQLLNIEPSAASRRYVRALARLQERLRLSQVDGDVRHL